MQDSIAARLKLLLMRSDRLSSEGDKLVDRLPTDRRLVVWSLLVRLFVCLHITLSYEGQKLAE